MTFESPRTTGEPTGSMTHVCDVHEHFTRLERLLVLIYRQGAKLMATLAAINTALAAGTPAAPAPVA